MSGITVIKGYHYGSTKNGHPYLHVNKPYYWRISRKTKHTNRLRKDISAIVKTKYGKKHVVVNDIQYLNGSIAIKIAKNLRPVLDIRNHGLVRMFKKWYLYDKRKGVIK